MTPLPHTDFRNAFRRGAVFRDRNNTRFPVQQIDIADLILPSGRIAACDPSFFGGMYPITPFTRGVPRGTYRVSLSLFLRTVACAKVQFSPADAVRWEMALWPGQDLATLKVGGIFGYGVDIGTGCFLDAEELARLGDAEQQSLCDEIVAALEGESWASVPIDPSGPANVVAFSSGDGDGAYASYWGFDASGRICSLVTDFAILVQHLEGRASIRIRDVAGKTIEHPDLSAIGVEVRIIPQGKPYPYHIPVNRHLRVELTGGGCTGIAVKVSNVGKEYGPKQNSYTDGCTKGTLDFNFDEPLDIAAEIRLDYGLGVKALEVVE
jgi:Protein of unknown function (DUF4241)